MHHEKLHASEVYMPQWDSTQSIWFNECWHVLYFKFITVKYEWLDRNLSTAVLLLKNTTEDTPLEQYRKDTYVWQ